MKKLLLFLWLLFSLVNQMTFAQSAFNDSKWWISSEKTIDGSIVIKIEERYSYLSGYLIWENNIENHIWLQYQDESFQWKTIIRISWNNNTFQFEHFGESNHGYCGKDLDYGLVKHFSYIHFSPPVDQLYNTEIQFRILMDTDFVGDPAVGSEKHATAYKPTEPENIEVSDNECGVINLSWDPPSNIGSYSGTYKIFYNGSDDAHLAGTSDGTSFSHTGRSPGEENDYIVQFVIIDDGNWYGGMKSEPIKGRSHPLLEPPFLEATNDDCSGKITLSWDYSDSDCTGFELYWSESSDVNTAKLFADIPKTQKSYVDSNVDKGKTYYYWISAVNSCDSVGNKSTSATGIAPDKPTAPSNIGITKTPKSLDVSWQHTSSNETGYQIIRTNQQSGAQTTFEIAKDLRSYTDQDISMCISYQYEVFAVNDCGSTSGGKIADFLSPDISNSFAANSLKASKGYYPDKVRLTWTNSQANLLSYYIISRRPLGSSDDWELINNPANTTSIWLDQSAEAGVIYEYKIQGVGLCNGSEVTTNEVSDVGFRTPSGVVTGKISYEGGVAVAGAQVLAENSEGLSGYSLEFKGDGYINIPHKSVFESDQITVQLWVKPSSLDSPFSIINKMGQWALFYDSVTDKITFRVETSGGSCEARITEALDPDLFSHITGVFDGQWINLFMNGIKLDSLQKSAIITPSSSEIVVGYDPDETNNFFSGIIDEIRIWNRALSETEIARDFGRYLNGAEDGLAAYWRCDEGVGSVIYDCSKDGSTFHENQGQLAQISWTDVLPLQSQLGLKAISDSNGNYVLNNIRYTDAGNVFTLTPFFGQHQFSPSSRTLFIGEGASVHNDKNFTDVSAFKVTGNVKYNGCDCFVEGVNLYIDGNMVIKQGQAVVTDQYGVFEIEVPIGYHSISVGMEGHVFDPPGWPTSGEPYNFTEPVSSIEFKDMTTVKVVGRVVGGLIEAAKKPALGLSINNIGTAEITFESELKGGGCRDTSFTNANSGEYEISLLPLRYKIDSVRIFNNIDNILFGAQDVLDLTVIEPLKQVSDTVWKVDGSIDTIYTASYQVQRDFIYWASPEVNVTDLAGNPFIGDDTVAFNGINGQITKIPVASLALEHPLFTMQKRYRTNISVFEKYTNYDDPDEAIFDQVPVTDAVILITNLLSMNEKQEEFRMSSSDGKLSYPFVGGIPSVLDPYTKTFEIYVKTGPGGAKKTKWLPVAGDTENDQIYRGYVLGSKPIGSNFVTNGPQVVDFILRDPPGTTSYSFLDEGQSYSSVESWSIDVGLQETQNHKLFAGVKFETGGGLLGPAVETTNEHNIQVGMTKNSSSTDSGEINYTYSFDRRIETSKAVDYVGEMGDLFFGQSINITYGETRNFEIFPIDIPAGGLITKIMDINDSFYLGIKDGFFVNPEGFSTMFVFTQNHIVNYIIPQLEIIRNSVFTEHSSDYQSHLEPDSVLFGVNNDDERLEHPSSVDPIETMEDDYTGESYTYTPPDTAKNTPDLIRGYNQQIRLWKEALQKNEMDKLKAKLIHNVSFDAGASLEESWTTSRSETESTSFEISIDVNLNFQTVSKLGAVGYEKKKGWTLTKNSINTEGTTYETTTTVGFVLADENAGDFFTVDIKRPTTGSGLVFHTKGGQSSCPWEEKVVTKYYKKGTTLNEATMQREIPVVEIYPSIVANVPEDEAAEFTLILGNESASGDDFWYETQVVESSNPNGANIRIDGESASRAFEVKAGQSISKLLTVRKDPQSAINEYNDLKLVFKSLCQADIADTVTFSVNFIPTCSKIKISAPSDLWIANYSNHDTLPITVSGYNINLNNFTKLNIQYKPKNDPDWINLATYYKNQVPVYDPLGRLIDPNKTSITYFWNLKQVIDGPYQVRATTTCPLAGNISSVVGGTIDRINPHPFGTPQPGDGILQPNDEIMIQFNEEINGNLLTPANFEFKGILNGTSLTHGTSLHFDGVTENYVLIPEGIYLNDKSFTLELWVKRDGSGEQCLISQGSASSEGLSMGFDANDQFFVLMADQFVSTDTVTHSTDWHHWVVVYNKEDNNTIEIYKDGEVKKYGSFPVSNPGTGRILLGKQTFGDDPIPFTGSLHEFRVWNTIRTQPQIVLTMNTQLNGQEKGLIGNWRMDEAFGSIIQDIVHQRNGQAFTTWAISPSGNAVSFETANSYMDFKAGELAFTDQMDFTIEFWFKSNNGKSVTLFSNGKGDLTGSNTKSWAIRTDADGNIKVYNQNLTFMAAGNQFWDNQWHHFALIVSRLGNIQSLIDGNLQYNQSSSGWGEFGGGKIWIGCRGWLTGTIENHAEFFQGKMDEIRIWGVARKQDQIKRNMNHRIDIDDYGLLTYFPFETHVNDGGVLVPSTSWKNEKISGADNEAKPFNGAAFTILTPNIKLKRPVQKVNFNWAFNNDKIIITPTDPPGLLENTILDVTVKGVRDLYGNTLQSPVTWSVYIDRNQVKWEDKQLDFEKILYQPLEFTANIINAGGTQQSFSIDNLPDWLVANPQSGTLDPLSTKSIRFTVNTALPIGKYAFDAYLHTNFNFDEKLLIQLQVYQPGPDWKVDPDAFEFSMNIVGQLSVDDIISNDVNDMVAAFINGECRGVANLQYIPEFDMYELYLSIYSNSIAADKIEFRVWNASEGKVHTEVTPVLNFDLNSILGSPLTPQRINALNTFEQVIPLPKGWRWVSLNLQSNEFAKPDSLLRHLTPNSNSLVKGQSPYIQYSTSTGWFGSLSTGGGFVREEMYKFYSDHKDTIRYIGARVNPSKDTLHLTPNWNWVGYIPDIPLTVDQALGYLNAQNGDLIKSQTAFSIYVPQIGWLGNLLTMQPGQGYMMKMTEKNNFVYPKDALFGKKSLWSDPIIEVIEEDISPIYSRNMSVLAAIEPGEYFVQPGSLTLEAWSDHAIRGICEANLDPGGSRWLHFLNVNGEDQAENLIYVVRDKQSGLRYEVTEKLKYAPDRVEGSYDEPVILTLKGVLSSGFGTGFDIPEDPLGLTIFPNPFGHNLLIEYNLSATSHVSIDIYDPLGKKIVTIVDALQLSGNQHINWNGNDAHGNPLSSGIYHVRVITDQGTASQRVVKSN